MTKPRLQINIRMDNEPKLYEAIKFKAEELNTSISELTIAALRHSLGWQIPIDASALLKKINALESEVKIIKRELKDLKSKE